MTPKTILHATTYLSGLSGLRLSPLMALRIVVGLSDAVDLAPRAEDLRAAKAPASAASIERVPALLSILQHDPDLHVGDARLTVALMALASAFDFVQPDDQLW